MQILDMALRPAGDHVVADVVEGDAVIINLATKTYYSTEGVGGWIWEQAALGHALGALVDTLAASSGQSREDIARDVTDFAEEAVREELAGPVPADPGAPPIAATGAYRAPALLAFRDMQDLLALDPPMPRFDTIR